MPFVMMIDHLALKTMRTKAKLAVWLRHFADKLYTYNYNLVYS